MSEDTNSDLEFQGWILSTAGFDESILVVPGTVIGVDAAGAVSLQPVTPLLAFEFTEQDALKMRIVDDGYEFLGSASDTEATAEIDCAVTLRVLGQIVSIKTAAHSNRAVGPVLRLMLTERQGRIAAVAGGGVADALDTPLTPEQTQSERAPRPPLPVARREKSPQLDGIGSWLVPKEHEKQPEPAVPSTRENPRATFVVTGEQLPTARSFTQKVTVLGSVLGGCLLVIVATIWIVTPADEEVSQPQSALEAPTPELIDFPEEAVVFEQEPLEAVTQAIEATEVTVATETVATETVVTEAAKDVAAVTDVDDLDAAADASDVESNVADVQEVGVVQEVQEIREEQKVKKQVQSTSSEARTLEPAPAVASPTLSRNEPQSPPAEQSAAAPEVPVVAASKPSTEKPLPPINEVQAAKPKKEKTVAKRQRPPVVVEDRSTPLVAETSIPKAEAAAEAKESAQVGDVGLAQSLDEAVADKAVADEALSDDAVVEDLAITEEPKNAELPLLAISDLAAVSQPQPRFPRRRPRGAELSVDLELTVDVTGGVSGLKTLNDVPERFERAAVRGVEQWRFEPHVVDGVAVPVKTRVRITFRN